MKQIYLVHYYIVDYIKRKEEKYLIPFGRFKYFIPRYLGFRHLNLIRMVKLISINSSFWLGNDFDLLHMVLLM